MFTNIIYIYFLKNTDFISVFTITLTSREKHCCRDLNRVFPNFTRDLREVRCGFIVSLICNTTSLHCDQLSWGKKRAEEERTYFLLCLLEGSNNSHSQQVFTPVLPTLSWKPVPSASKQPFPVMMSNPFEKGQGIKTFFKVTVLFFFSFNVPCFPPFNQHIAYLCSALRKPKTCLLPPGNSSLTDLRGLLLSTRA